MAKRNQSNHLRLTPEYFRKHLPETWAWALSQERAILDHGVPLTTRQARDAVLAGVAYPENVRLLWVHQVSIPDLPLIQALAEALVLDSSLSPSFAVRHGVFICGDYWGQRWPMVLALAHTAQCERLGMRAYLECYLYECLFVGYPSAPMERDAINVAVRICGPRPSLGTQGKRAVPRQRGDRPIYEG